jgi:SAM-dependent methyltransferase
MLDRETLRLLGLPETATCADVEALRKLPTLGYCENIANALVDTHVKHVDTFIDLACGSGAALISMASRYGSRCIGIDICEPLLSEAKIRVNDSGMADLVSLACADLRRGWPIALNELGLIGISSVGDLFGPIEIASQFLAAATSPGQVLLWMESHARPEMEFEVRSYSRVHRVITSFSSAGWEIVDTMNRRVGGIPSASLARDPQEQLVGITCAFLFRRTSALLFTAIAYAAPVVCG